MNTEINTEGIDVIFRNWKSGMSAVRNCDVIEKEPKLVKLGLFTLSSGPTWARTKDHLIMSRLKRKKQNEKKPQKPAIYLLHMGNISPMSIWVVLGYSGLYLKFRT